MLATEIVSFPYTFQVLRIDLKIDQSEREIVARALAIAALEMLCPDTTAFASHDSIIARLARRPEGHF